MPAIAYYWRLSGFYLFYFALLGALVPYWSLYLRDAGYSASQIGLLMALPQLTKLVAPSIWGYLADRTGQRLRVIRAGTLVAALAFMLVFVADSFLRMAAVLALFSFFWNAVLAQYEVVTLETLGVQANRYTHVRVWGSIGFMLSVILIGAALDRVSVMVLPWILVGLLWLIWLCTMALPEADGGRQRSERGHGLMQLLRQPSVLVFLLLGFLMQLSHGPYYTFFTIHLDELHVPRAYVGALWALGVLAEVLVFLVMHRLLHRFTLERILQVSLALAALRWVMLATVADVLPALVVAQCLHAFSFGTFHAASIAWVHRAFGRDHAGQGQALYSSVGFGAGWAMGAWLAGIYWSELGAATFWLVALVAGVAALLSLMLRPVVAESR